MEGRAGRGRASRAAPPPTGASSSCTATKPRSSATIVSVRSRPRPSSSRPRSPSAIFLLFRRAAAASVARLARDRGASASLGFLPATFLARALPLHDCGRRAVLGLLVLVARRSLGVALPPRRPRPTALDGAPRRAARPVVLLVRRRARRAPRCSSTARSATHRPSPAGSPGFSNPAYATRGRVDACSPRRCSRTASAGAAAPGPASRSSALVVVVDGAPFWGSDVGGILSMVPAFGVTAVMLLGRRVRWQTVGWCVARPRGRASRPFDGARPVPGTGAADAPRAPRRARSRTAGSATSSSSCSASSPTTSAHSRQLGLGLHAPDRARARPLARRRALGTGSTPVEPPDPEVAIAGIGFACSPCSAARSTTPGSRSPASCSSILDRVRSSGCS